MKEIKNIGRETDFHGFKMYEFEFDSCKCYVAVPDAPLPGQKWIWKAEYFSAFPVFEIEMLKRGYYFCFMQTEYAFGAPHIIGRHWDKFYTLLTAEYGFNKKVILFGLSVGGLYIYNWAAANPEKIACVYGDNPVCDIKSWPGGKGVGPGSPEHWEMLKKYFDFKDDSEALAYTGNPIDDLQTLIDADIPLIHAAATDDEVVPICENTDVLERRCLALGGKITIFRHPGKHHPHHAVDNLPLLLDTICNSAKY